MSIPPIHNSSPQLRLVDSAGHARPVQPQAPVESAAKTRQFNDVYEGQATGAPRVSLIEAQRRLEKIRKIIAAQTTVPIHFDPPALQSQASRSANPYQPAYLKFPISPADQNAAATDRAADA